MATTLLVADRSSTQLQLIDMLLAQEGFRLVLVTSGRETLQFLRENTPDLAILDLELPDLGGADICQKVKMVSRLSRMPVILTAPETPELGLDDRVKTLAQLVRADLVLQKPLGDKNLRGRIKGLLERRERMAGQSGTGTRTTQVLVDTLEIMNDASPPAAPAGPEPPTPAPPPAAGATTPAPKANPPAAATGSLPTQQSEPAPAPLQRPRTAGTAAAVRSPTPGTAELRARLSVLERTNEILTSRLQKALTNLSKVERERLELVERMNPLRHRLAELERQHMEFMELRGRLASLSERASALELENRELTAAIAEQALELEPAPRHPPASEVPASAANDEREELARELERLRNRNRLLLDALEKRDAREDSPRRLFRRKM